MKTLSTTFPWMKLLQSHNSVITDCYQPELMRTIKALLRLEGVFRSTTMRRTITGLRPKAKMKAYLLGHSLRKKRTIFKSRDLIWCNRWKAWYHHGNIDQRRWSNRSVISLGMILLYFPIFYITLIFIQYIFLQIFENIPYFSDKIMCTSYFLLSYPQNIWRCYYLFIIF